jgi:hypothetical protein
MNLPSAPFLAPHTVTLIVDFDCCDDDQRRIDAELWCCHRASGRWFRSIDKRYGHASFSFASLRDAALFRLTH